MRDKVEREFKEKLDKEMKAKAEKAAQAFQLAEMKAKEGEKKRLAALEEAKKRAE